MTMAYYHTKENKFPAVYDAKIIPICFTELRTMKWLQVVLPIAELARIAQLA